MVLFKNIYKLIPHSFMILSFLGFGQTSLDTSLTTERNFREGKLKNGMKYYIKSVPNSQPTIHLKLLVRVGVHNQDSSQADIAHFVEHMAFKTTENFPKGIQNHTELLNRNNMSRFDLKAHYGQRFTEYIYLSPDENIEALKTGLLWFEDIAVRLKMTPQDIDSEREVMIQEFIERSGDNLDKSIVRNKLKRQLLPGHQNLTDISMHLRNFEPEKLKNFYKDWYRPDLMGVIVVGSLDNIDKIEQEIIKRLSDIPVKQNPKQPVNYDSIFLNQPPRFVVVNGNTKHKNSEASTTLFNLHFRDKSMLNLSSNFEVLKRKYKWSIFQDILNKRFREASNVYNSPFSANMFQRGILPLSLRLKLSIKNGKEEEALKKTFQILKQLQKYGVSGSEFKEAMERQLHAISNNNEQEYWIEAIKTHFLNEETIQIDSLENFSNWASNFKLDDFNQFIRQENFSMPEDIGIIASSDHQKLLYKENEIRNWIKEIDKESIHVYSPPPVPKYLLSPNKINEFKEGKIEDMGVGASGAMKFKLKNGVNLILKPFKPSPGVEQDNILIHGIAPIGALDFPHEDYFSAVNAPGFIKNSGAGGFDKFQIQRYLANSSLWWGGIHLYLDNLESGIKIGASPTDLEKMLQVIYLYFTQPNKSKDAFQDWKKDQKRFYKNPSSDLKDTDLRVLIRKVLGDSSEVLTGTERFKGLEKTNMNRGHEIYRNIFQASNEFTFIVSGEFKKDSVLPIFNKYLGNLPNDHTESSPESKQLTKNSLPKGPFYKEFVFPGNYNKSNVLYKPKYIKATNIKPDWKEKLRIQALGAVVNKLVWDLRFEKGYALYVTGAVGEFNEKINQYSIGASFNCLPEEYPLLRKEFSQIINNLKSDLITEELLEQSLKRLRFLSVPDGRIKSNREMQNRLYSHYRYDTEWIDPKKKFDFIKTLSPEDIKESANVLFKDEYLYEFVIGKNL
ncbi:insulinase family protein [Salegentibacter sp. LM13S]|uniref:M16 family metallopeptidase n=1 Tax=Salegentibacter lacus TaxID=2873599 RepID=UPI001CCD4F07|nr:insulinase family protein [Salegentibacter lacus]MBZ9629795.1 insulinase family protein [Salegentibacter lacus]